MAPPRLRPCTDPDTSLARIRREWGEQAPLWVFGYASLIWSPAFKADEARPARVAGWHRALRMRSVLYRGTPSRPGLVCALLRGGCCLGRAYRLDAARAQTELPRLWAREMPMAVYEPRWLACQTPQGQVRALGFTLPPDSPYLAPHMDDVALRQVLAQARGERGSTLAYVRATVQCLRDEGIRDRELERLARLTHNWPEPA
ncbi:gamma-glutamylcyclotransferase [Ideonella livida]|uniref:glutathione-specific gamma-glutamylcyclotransferase n=1 Tax=Ideonella livida TaxID=2707176 RepID=A0A7C9PES4_9BURK|nr:gamma-glutamylcyclotransferase [Ideonella livida]NDY90073.1 gamma-glutamylcyclotransferase [Ideonella livida]